MRFMLCARDRATGAMSLVSGWSFLNRREAVEAISGVRDFSEFSGSDIFLVDLERSTPVAVVPWRAEDITSPDTSHDAGAEETSQAPEPAAQAEPFAGEVSAPEAETAAEPEPVTQAAAEPEPEVWSRPIVLGTVEIDIEAWTCEDCIYVSTCARCGTVRPAECGSFQWRA